MFKVAATIPSNGVESESEAFVTDLRAEKALVRDGLAAEGREFAQKSR